MDFRFTGTDWVGNICQNFETVFMEVDDIIFQEPFKYVENQLLTTGANVKQFCSEFVQDVLPPFLVDSMQEAAHDLSIEKNKNSDIAAYESSNVHVVEDPIQGICNSSSLPHASYVEPIERLLIDLSLQQNADIGMNEMSNVVVRGNSVEEKPLPSKIPEVVASVEKDSSVASLFCGVNPTISVEVKGCNSSMEAGESSNLVNATADILYALPSASTVILVESSECKFLDSGVTSPGDALSAVSNDTSAAYVTVSMTESSWVGFELSDEYDISEDVVSVADSERSDDISAEEARDDIAIEPGMETTQPFDELKLDDSCIVVDCDEFCSVFDLGTKHMFYKKKVKEADASKMKGAKEQELEQQATRCQDLNAGSNQLRGKSFTESLPTGKLETSDHDFCESEWEII